MFAAITMIDYRKPLARRAADRKTFGPYVWAPAKAGTGRAFYCAAGRGLACDVAGSTFDLRLEEAPLRCRARSYAAFDSSVDYTPIIARLPRSRGFLAGWTMGASMLATLDSEVYESERDAMHAAHDAAERAAIEEHESSGDTFGDEIGEEE